jgi:hypothetical protein
VRSYATLLGPVHMCSATPYLAPDSWQDGRLKLGDAAFPLDPISSSGVENAMRFSLQAAVALNTMLGGDHATQHELAGRVFESRLVEACARHAHWTEAYYAQAWCANQSFWQMRARCEPHDNGVAHPALMSVLSAERARLARYQPPTLQSLCGLDPALLLRLHNSARVVELPCFVDDRVCLHTALDHPCLERPLAFLENEGLFLHLPPLRQPLRLSQLLQMLATNMPDDKARRIVAWLWQRGLSKSVS